MITNPKEYIKFWYLREQHAAACKDAFIACGNLPNGPVRIFNGPVAFAKLQELGHTEFNLEDCKCWIGRNQ